VQSWIEDVTGWARLNGRDPKKVERILLRHGWNPQRYRAEMRTNLNHWLDQWYTLSIKTLPSPATARKKNPDSEPSEDSEFGLIFRAKLKELARRGLSVRFATRQIVDDHFRQTGRILPQHLVEKLVIKYWPYEKNPDEEIRRLERLAESGDTDALRKLRQLQIRSGVYPQRSEGAHQMAKERHARRRWRNALPVHLKRMIDDRGLLTSYAWPGGYDVMYLTREGDTLCSDCANDPDTRDLEAAYIIEDIGREQCDSCQRVLQGDYCYLCRENVGGEGEPECEHEWCDICQRIGCIHQQDENDDSEDDVGEE